MPLPSAQGDSPTQGWIRDWVDFLSSTLPLIFLVVVLVGGTVLIVRSRGGLQRAIIFGLGAALVFLILTNVEAISELFQQELPVDGED